MGSLTYIEPDLVIKTEEDAMKEDHEMMDLEEEEGLRLDTLPAETLLHVLEYLDVKFITETLSQVCFCYSLDWSILPDSNDLDQSQDMI